MLNPTTQTVWQRDQTIPLSVKEFAILEYLMRNPNQVLTRDQLLEHIWDFSYQPRSNVLDAHIKNIRHKFNFSSTGIRLETVRGVGYRLMTAI